MEDADLYLEFSLAWWFTPYFWLLAFFCLLMRAQPDEAKLERMVRRAMRIKVIAQ